MSGMVIEWAPFLLAEGASEEALLAASESLQQEFLGRQPGFVSRQLLRGEGRQWCDLVYWENAEAVERAMARVAESPVCHQYFQLMTGANHDDPGAGVQLLSVRERYGRAP